MKHIYIAGVLIAFFVTCKKESAPDCLTSNGPDITEARSPGVFKAINVTDKFEVNIKKGNDYLVEVTSGAHIISRITTKISGDTLRIENRNRCNFVRGYKRKIRINITLPQLEYLENSGVGIVKLDEAFEQDSISARLSSSGDVYLNGKFRVIKTSSNGNGDVYLNGQSKALYVYTNGTNYVQAGGLTVSEYMFIHTSTLGDCHVNATGTKRMDYNIENTGNVYYRGDPLEIGNFSSSEAGGSLIKE